MRTRQQGTTITVFPSQMIEKIVTMVGVKSPIDAFKCQLICNVFRDSATSKAIYQTMNTNRLRLRQFSVDMDEVIHRCRNLNNPHILFNDGMILFFMRPNNYTCNLAKYFLLGEDEAEKQLLQDAAEKGQLDVIFFLGLLLMTEGSERKQEAPIMMNNAYINTRRSWNLKQTCYKVRSHLVRGRRSKYGKDFMHEYNWLFNYDICLWDACLVELTKLFDISLE
uniref:At2g35280-like TPR domain-containing protein n=1 Tax=Lactuca sativa TaxID=4236 RepID=A0A9R1VS83_LACSA|nr:hypothetical protein LSAT_V11C400196450 [Lactuca sativa]